MENLMDIAIQAAHVGGEVVKAHYGHQTFVEKKLNFDYVTDVDMLSERSIREYLAKKCPDFGFMGEETVYKNYASEDAFLDDLSDDSWTWIVDPLDGTMNFIRQIPQFCVSVALAQGRELVAGAVLDVSQGAMFSAEKGRGAYLNGKPIHISPVENLREAIIGAAFPAAEVNKRGIVMDALNRMTMDVGSIRIYNSAALMMCYIACGRLDVGFECGIHIWDMAAGTVIVREAGGEVLHCDGSPFTIYSREQFSGNPAILKAVRPYLQVN